jgi:hypothetical protein
MKEMRLVSRLRLQGRMSNLMRLGSLSIAILAFSAVALAQAPYPQQNPYPEQNPNPNAQQQYPQAQNSGQGQATAPTPQDEPGRAVARLGILNGEASIQRGDSSDWVAAAVNAPLMSGDQISVAAGSRAEIQLDAAHFLRMAGDTELRLADIDNGHYQIQISHGMVTWRILRTTQTQAEIDTPLVGVHPGAQSVVRVEVDGDGTSHITVRRGEAQVSTQKGSERVTENTTMDVRGSMNDPEFQVVAAAARGEWDSWSDQRDAYLQRAQAPRYVPPDVSGVEDLDAYGHWVYDPAYGWVWAPTVASSWAPYQNGQWVWEDYYGWTWVDYAPWGWAPFHYGYWYNRVGFGWSWFPGPRVGRVWWRPAMVGFFGWGGGVGVGFGFGNIGWCPLAPFETFRPWYGRGGFREVNIVRNVSVVGAFRNAGAVGGVTAVSAVDFQRGNFRNTVAVDRGTLQRASLVHGTVPVTPSSQNLRFSNRVASVQTSRTTVGAASPRFYGSSAGSVGVSSPAVSARRTPFAQQQAAVRSAVSGPAAIQSQMAGQAQARVPQAQAPSSSMTRPAQGSAGSWQRFEGAPARNAPAANSQGGRPAPGYNRYVGTPNAVPNNAVQGNAPRQFQVSPSIVRQRPEVAPAPSRAPAPGPSYGGGGGGGAPRNAPPAGGNRGSGTHSSGRR